ncbi:B12-binding domain-containing protein [Methylobacterium sp. J-076]|uniref:cobalamin B12-binding domain-containing protein n=1 Tax=Methylobacterium sp. J-076 TaxID=2836655 RepID=UPI001FB9CB85|nr:cobalamin B12-binding domain-containing protein [Methylobacterium sp. J-076]MCJ2015002.1 cobalamin B12-binding domain-containing protein [Methylobacterium sp. J-076]
MDDQGHLCEDCVSSLPGDGEDDRDVLAWLVEAEILPRLMMAHRRPGRSAPVAPLRDFEALAAILLAPGPFDLDAAVDALQAGDLPLDRLLLDLLAPAARRLGTKWEDDTCDFLAVTDGLGRLQTLTRRLCAGMERAASPSGRSVLLMPCPGETHVYGLSILGSFFRESGWDVTNLGHSPENAAEMLRSGWYDVLGVSLSCDVCAPALKTLVPALRRVSRNPSLFVMVGGPYFARTGTGPAEVGADAYAPDAWSAPGIAEATLDRPAVAC